MYWIQGTQNGIWLLATVRKRNKYVHCFVSQKPSAAAHREGCLGTAHCLARDAVTSTWRSGDILVWTTEITMNHSQFSSQDQRTKTLDTCLSTPCTCMPWYKTPQGSCEIPATQNRLSCHFYLCLSNYTAIRSHMARFCLLLHGSLFWDLITELNLILHKGPCMLDHWLLNIISNRRERQRGESTVNAPMLWCRLCLAALHMGFCLSLGS